MSWPYVLDEKTSELVELLAKENEVTPEIFIKKLVAIEDSKMHIHYEPYVGEIRVKCYRSNCKEERERMSYSDYEL